MIELVLAHADLARVRFAHSPIHELVASLLVLQDPSRRPMYGGWLSLVRPRLGDLQLELLTALAPPGRFLPAFLFPPPAVPRPTLADELEALVASPPAMVRAELDKLCDGRPLPSGLGSLYADPAARLSAVAEALQRYWEIAVLPVWPRLQAVCTVDLTYRMERFADGGLARVLADLHPELAMAGDRLRIDKPHHCHQSFDLAGVGIVLVPAAFIWPALMVACYGVDQPTLVYPPRGMAELWDEPSAEPADPLIALVGRTRSLLLARLNVPRTTTQLAGQLELSPPAVSRHLKILKATALVTARRRGRMVLYQRTSAGTALLKAVRSQEEAG